MRKAVLILRQGGFRFSTIKFRRHQLAILFVEDMAKRKLIVFQVNENNTFLNVIYALHIALKFDYSFYFFQCLRGVQDHIPDSTPLFKIFCFLTHSIIFAVNQSVFKTRRFSFLYHQVFWPSAGYLVR